MYLLKRKHYSGAESVVGRGSKAVMESEAARLNGEYQSDNYYVEAWDERKFDWPDLSTSGGF